MILSIKLNTNKFYFIDTFESNPIIINYNFILHFNPKYLLYRFLNL